jgi:hypothetical protein
MSKKISNHTISKVAFFAAGVIVATGVATSHTNSAQDAADYAAKTCKVAPR